jgi:hypothetical protein
MYYLNQKNMKKTALLITVISAIILTGCFAPTYTVRDEIIMAAENSPETYQRINSLNLSSNGETKVVRYLTGSNGHKIKVYHADDLWESEEFWEINEITPMDNGDVYYSAINEEGTKLMINNEIALEESVSKIYQSPDQSLFIKARKDNLDYLMTLEGEELRKSKIINQVAFDHDGNIAYTYKNDENKWVINYKETAAEGYQYISEIAFDEDNSIAYLTRNSDNIFSIHINDEVIDTGKKHDNVSSVTFYDDDEIAYLAYNSGEETWTLNINEEEISKELTMTKIVGKKKNLHLLGRGNEGKPQDFVYDIKKEKKIAETEDIGAFKYIENFGQIYTEKDNVGAWFVVVNGFALAEAPNKYIQIGNFIESEGTIKFLAEMPSGDVILATVKKD